MNLLARLSLLFLLPGILLALTSCTVQEWSQFRGPNRDLLCSETGLLERWPEEGPPLVWKQTGLGSGFSSISVSGDLLFTHGFVGDKEKVLALHRDDGREMWSVDVGPVKEVGPPGSRSTPTVDGDVIYVEAVDGGVYCLKKTTGDVVWSKHLKVDFNGVQSGPWGYSEAPLVDGEKVVFTPGGPEATLLALDKRTGDVIWKAQIAEGAAASYSSAIVANSHGVRQYIQYLHDTVVGVRASDGKVLWTDTTSVNPNKIHCSSPVFHDDHVFTASSYGHGGALVKLTSTEGDFTAEKVYFTKDMKNHHGGFFLKDGYIYGTDEAILTCLDFKTGEKKWETRSVGKGAVLYVDGHFILRSEGGPVALVEANPEKYVEKGRFEQPDRSDQPAWAYPVVSDGRLYLRDKDILLCYDLRDKDKS